MVLDNTEHDDLNPARAHLLAPAGSKLFPMSYLEYANVFSRAVEALQHAPLGALRQYQLRHGGASHE
eukprot:4841936-Pyramimonas_sp.AAC.1